MVHTLTWGGITGDKYLNSSSEASCGLHGVWLRHFGEQLAAVRGHPGGQLTEVRIVKQLQAAEEGAEGCEDVLSLSLAAWGCSVETVRPNLLAHEKGSKVATLVCKAECRRTRHLWGPGAPKNLAPPPPPCMLGQSQREAPPWFQAPKASSLL